MKIKIICIVLLSVMALSSFADDVVNGKTLFTARCATCHKLGSVLVGPDLTGVDKRRKIDWIIKFVQSSQTVIKNGDKDAVALFSAFNKFQMPDHPDLKENDIKNILLYINDVNVHAPREQAPFTTPDVVKPNYTPLSIHSYGLIIFYLGLVALLAGVLFFAVNVQLLGNKTKENKNTI